MRLARISHAGVTSEDLRPGQWRPLSLDELIALKRDYGVPKKVRAPLFEPALGKGGWDEQPRTPGARRPEPKFSAARRKGEKAKKEPAHFDRRRTPARRDEATVVEGKPFNARNTENKRFHPEAAEPARFDRKRSPKGSHGAAGSGREASFHGERAQSARRDQSKRPWETRSRSASEGRPSTTSARPSADRAPGHRGRVAPNATRGGDKDQVAPKAFNAAHREKKRFNAKNAEPKAFEEKRTRAPAARGAAPFIAKGDRRPNREASFEPARGRSSGPSRDASSQREIERGPSRKNPNRPWEARARSASEGRSLPSSARPSTDRASGKSGRSGPPAKRAGGRASNDTPFAAKRGRGPSR